MAQITVINLTTERVGIAAIGQRCRFMDLNWKCVFLSSWEAGFLKFCLYFRWKLLSCAYSAFCCDHLLLFSEAFLRFSVVCTCPSNGKLYLLSVHKHRTAEQKRAPGLQSLQLEGTEGYRHHLGQPTVSMGHQGRQWLLFTSSLGKRSQALWQHPLQNGLLV